MTSVKLINHSSSTADWNYSLLELVIVSKWMNTKICLLRYLVFCLALLDLL